MGKIASAPSSSHPKTKCRSEGISPPYSGHNGPFLYNPDGTMGTLDCDEDNYICTGTSPWLWGTLTVTYGAGCCGACYVEMNYCGVEYSSMNDQPRCGTMDDEISNSPFQDDDVEACFLPGCPPDTPCADTGVADCQSPDVIDP